MACARHQYSETNDFSPGLVIHPTAMEDCTSSDPWLQPSDTGWNKLSLETMTCNSNTVLQQGRHVKRQREFALVTTFTMHHIFPIVESRRVYHIGHRNATSNKYWGSKSHARLFYFPRMIVFVAALLCNFPHLIPSSEAFPILPRSTACSPRTVLKESTLACKIIDGKAIAASVRDEIKLRVADLRDRTGQVPGLAVILVGSRRDSQTYVNMKKKACAAAGITSVGFDLDDTVTEEELLAVVDRLNHDPSIHGILIQLPLPKHIHQDKILQGMDPKKDVDGLHPVNVANLQLYTGSALEAPFSIPCTPLGCLVLLDKSGVDLRGKHCVVIGRSALVGLPMARLLLGRDATVTICHSKTQDLAKVVKTADVVIAAVGVAGLVQGDWIKSGAVVIDVGINSVDIVPEKTGGRTYKLVGDVHYKSAAQVASQITPVPGGVGPMTIAMLLKNTLASFERTLE